MGLRTYWDLTEREWAELTSADVEKFVDAELMVKGVLKVAPLLIEPEVDAPEPATTYYQVVNTYGNSVFDPLFRTAEDAQAFLALKPMRDQCEWGGGTSVHYAEEALDLSVRAVKVFSVSEKTNYAASIKRASAAKGENERRRREHDEARKKQEDALKGLWEDWHACRAKASRLERVASTLADYERTAGDRGVALKFLAKVFSSDEIGDAFAWYGIEPSSEIDLFKPVQ